MPLLDSKTICSKGACCIAKPFSAQEMLLLRRRIVCCTGIGAAVQQNELLGSSRVLFGLLLPDFENDVRADNRLQAKNGNVCRILALREIALKAADASSFRIVDIKRRRCHGLQI